VAVPSGEPEHVGFTTWEPAATLVTSKHVGTYISQGAKGRFTLNDTGARTAPEPAMYSTAPNNACEFSGQRQFIQLKREAEIRHH